MQEYILVAAKSLHFETDETLGSEYGTLFCRINPFRLTPKNKNKKKKTRKDKSMVRAVDVNLSRGCWYCSNKLGSWYCVINYEIL